MSSEIQNEVSVAPAGGDSTALTSVQTDSFKSFDNFSSIKSSMTDTSSSALPKLELFSPDGDLAQKAADDKAGQGDPPGDRRNDHGIFDPQVPRGIGQQGTTDSIPGLEGSSNRSKPDNGSKPHPTGDGAGSMQRRMPGRR